MEDVTCAKLTDTKQRTAARRKPQKIREVRQGSVILVTGLVI